MKKRLRNIEAVRRYQKTKKGLVTRIYADQRSGSKQRGHYMPAYSKQELKDWLFKQPKFHELYDDWRESNYDTLLSPSCDRLDDYKGYSLKRLQLMTWGENKRKGESDKKNGINNKNSKAVISTHKITGVEMEFYSTSKAERETKISHSHISAVCKGKRKTAGGYYWEFAE